MSTTGSGGASDLLEALSRLAITPHEDKAPTGDLDNGTRRGTHGNTEGFGTWL